MPSSAEGERPISHAAQLASAASSGTVRHDWNGAWTSTPPAAATLARARHVRKVERSAEGSAKRNSSLRSAHHHRLTRIMAWATKPVGTPSCMPWTLKATVMSSSDDACQ
eukprot:scaffold77829_cov68-Phaeocystis_antarctica.AAC.1